MQNGIRTLTSTDLNTLTTAQTEVFGALGQTDDGRVFRYVKFGGTATITPGLVMSGPAAPANSTALAITAAGTGGQVAANFKAGSNSLVVTNGVTSVTANQFQYLELVTATDLTYSLKIAGHTSAGSGGYVKIQLDEPLPLNATTLIAGTDTANLVYSHYNGVGASTTGNAPAGVTTVVVPNTASVTNYGWVQSGGKAFVKATTATIGLGIAQDLSGTAGYVIISAATTGNIGWAKASAASNTASVILNIN